jgi:hypothetical protein
MDENFHLHLTGVKPAEAPGPDGYPQMKFETRTQHIISQGLVPVNPWMKISTRT